MRVEISPLNLSGHGGPCCVINGVKIATVCLESPHLPPNALRSGPTAGGRGRGGGVGVAAGRGVAVRGGGAVGTGMTVPRTYPMRSLIIQTPEMQKQINFF